MQKQGNFKYQKQEKFYRAPKNLVLNAKYRKTQNAKNREKSYQATKNLLNAKNKVFHKMQKWGNTKYGNMETQNAKNRENSTEIQKIWCKNEKNRKTQNAKTREKSIKLQKIC